MNYHYWSFHYINYSRLCPLKTIPKQSSKIVEKLKNETVKNAIISLPIVFQFINLNLIQFNF